MAHLFNPDAKTERESVPNGNEQNNSEELINNAALAKTDALAKLLIAKGIITDAEFKAQLSVERANYLAVLKRMQ